MRETAELLSTHSPVSHHSYNGIIQHTNATQGARSIENLFALLGQHDTPGANLAPMPVRTASFSGEPIDGAVTAKRLQEDDDRAAGRRLGGGGGARQGVGHEPAADPDRRVLLVGDHDAVADEASRSQ